MPNHKIHKLRATIARLEAEIARDIHEELAILPRQFGFSSVTHFLRAVEEAIDGGKIRGRKKARKAAKLHLRKRAKITNVTRAEDKKLVKVGKTGTRIAKAVRTAKRTMPSPTTHSAPVKRTAAPKRPKKRTAPKKMSAPEITPLPVPIESLTPPA